MPSRMRTSSSASTTLVAFVLIATIMGYRDVMSTSAPPADPSNEFHRLVEQQAALRRIAMLVASGAPSSGVFDAVAQGVVQVLELENAWVCRYDEDGAAMTVLAVCGFRLDRFNPGS